MMMDHLRPFWGYQARRAALYEYVRQHGIFTWDHMYGEEYALASIHLISRELRNELAAATERLGAIFTKTVAAVQQGNDDLLHELGIPAAAFTAVRLSVLHEWPTVIGRFDFARTTEGIKMLEFNSDTPTGIVEAFHVNQIVCDWYQAENPNAGCNRDLQRAFAGIKNRYVQQGHPSDNVVFSSLNWHEEDAGTTRYLLQQSGLSGRFVPLADLRVYKNRLYAFCEGEFLPVDLLYRLHALEKLAEERDVDGYPTGERLLQIASSRNVALINPASAFIAQTKALQALIWNLHEQQQFYTDAEHEIIQTYMLPTYLENRFLQQVPFVTKPIFGREGGGVTLYHASGAKLEADSEPFYWDQPMVYQKLAPLEQIEIETLNGNRDAHLLWGSFLIGGRASAIVARAGGRITGNLSHYLPVAIDNKA